MQLCECVSEWESEWHTLKWVCVCVSVSDTLCVQVSVWVCVWVCEWVTHYVSEWVCESVCEWVIVCARECVCECVSEWHTYWGGYSTQYVLGMSADSLHHMIDWSIYHHMIDLITAWSVSITWLIWSLLDQYLWWLSIMLHIILVTALFVKLSKIKKMVSSFFIIITSYKCLFLICYVCHCRRQYIVVLGGVAQSCWEADQRYSHSRLRPLTVSAYTKETHLQPNVQPHSVYY